MTLNVQKEVAAMERMTSGSWRRSTPRCSANRPVAAQAVPDQADHLADAGQRGRRPVGAGPAASRELANDADLRVTAPRVAEPSGNGTRKRGADVRPAWSAHAGHQADP